MTAPMARSTTAIGARTAHSTTPMANAPGTMMRATISVVMPAMAVPGYKFTEAVRSAITSRRGMKLCLVSLSIR